MISEETRRENRGSTIAAMVFMGFWFAAIIAGVASDDVLPAVWKVILAGTVGVFGVMALRLIWLSGTKGERR